MKVITYMCENCFEPHIFNQDDDKVEFLCPKCGYEMIYFGTEEIDPVTKMVVNRYDEESRKNKNPGKPIQLTTINYVSCPYCHSTNTKKISGTKRWLSTGMFGLASSKIGKQWHCNSCKSDF